MPAGTVLRDRYRLTSTLTIGRVATVYRAEEVETGRVVMVKLFHEVGRQDGGRIQSFRRPTSSRAPRPEIPSAFVAVHECDLTDEGQLFLVTELVQGPSVADLLRRTPPLAPVRALELAMRIGEALDAARNLGLLDLRVAPGDIVVVDDRVKLLRSDALTIRRLGLASQLAAAEASERDPRYASPEELGGLPTTERSVVYRFGILLYELLSGSPPFEGTTQAEVRDRQLRPPPRRLRGRHQALPASLDRIVSRMLKPDPMARPVDLTSILNELWDAACRLRSESPARTAGAPTSPAAMAPGVLTRRSHMHRWALAGLPVLVVGGTLLTWPYLVGGPTAPTSDPASVPPAVDVAPPAAPAVPAPLLVPPPSDPGTSSGRVSTQVPEFHPPPGPPPPATEQPRPEPTTDGVGSPARIGSNAPVPSGVTQSESLPVPKDPKAGGAEVAPVREPPRPPRPAEMPAPPRAAAPAEPGATSTRANPTPPTQPETAVALPPVRPSQPQPENPGAADPAAIIEWLIREGPGTGR